MRIAQVVGNVISTIKDEGFYGQKLMIITFLDENLEPVEKRQIAFDVCDAGIGDIVVVNTDGGAANMLINKEIIADVTICGVLDHFYFDGEMIRTR